MKVYAVAVVLTLAGCVEPSVSDVQGDTVKVRSLGLANTAPDQNDIAKAASVCAVMGKSPVHVGTVPVAESLADFIFLCR